jgi:prepilin signal peptidase PulO-like enzyme (type II secretory pathway)
MIKIISILILLILSIIDYKTQEVPNVVTIPAIFIFAGINGFFIPSILTFLVLSVLTHHPEHNPSGILYWGGGDVKVFTIVASMVGLKVLFVFLITRLINSIRRDLLEDYKAYALTPYIFISALPFLIY